MESWFHATIDYWRAGGWLLIPLALVHVLIWSYFLHLRHHFLSLMHSGESLTSRLAETAGAPDKQSDGWAWLSSQPGGLAAWLRQVLAEIQQGARASDVFARHEDRAHRLWRRDLVILAALTSVAPLLGLLGTVAGMIFTFDAVSAGFGDTASRVAEGISTALITTQFGLVIAMPGLFGMARVRRLIRTVEVQLAECRSLVLVALGNAHGRMTS